MEGDSPGFFYLRGHWSGLFCLGAKWEQKVPIVGRQKGRKESLSLISIKIYVEEACNVQFICTYLLKNCRCIKGGTVQLKKYCLEERYSFKCKKYVERDDS